MKSKIHHDYILDSIVEGVFTVDLEYNITFFNNAAEQITGVLKKQAIGQKCFDVFRANICQNQCTLKSAISNKNIINLKLDILNSSGQTIPVMVNASALKDDEGKVIGGVETFRDISDIETLRKEISKSYTSGDIITKNHEILDILNLLPDLAISNSNVLIQGPSGTGKELFARAIHNLSEKEGKFIGINCAALPESLLESEIFGYKKGAFSDAKKDKPGRFALAQDGTLFLDEIGDISPLLQVKLLRVIQEKEYEPLGSTSTVNTNARIIAATNKSLEKLVSEGIFREDLFYRLNVFKINLPPLKRRKEDIPILVEHFINKFNMIKEKNILGITNDGLNYLMKHDYPGNIRELENYIEYAFVLCHGDYIETYHLPNEIMNKPIKENSSTPPLVKAEVNTIIDALKISKGNKSKAAAQLGIHPTTLWRKMKKYGITY